MLCNFNFFKVKIMNKASREVSTLLTTILGPSMAVMNDQSTDKAANVK